MKPKLTLVAPVKGKPAKALAGKGCCNSDVMRFYELSWLNNQGKPQIAILEIISPQKGLSTLDTISLKNPLNAFASKKYQTPAAMQNQLHQLFESVLPLPISQYEIRIYDHNNFHDSNVDSAKLEYEFSSYAIRFICHQTKQPCLGFLRITSTNEISWKSELITLLMTLRNKSFSGIVYADTLFKAIMAFSQQINLAMSLHLSRRGGFSWQFIRSNCHFLTHNSLVQRAAIE